MIDSIAIIDPKAKIGENVSIGPWTVIGPDVEIGDNCSIASHVVIRGPSIIGANNKITRGRLVWGGGPGESGQSSGPGII